MICCLLKEIDKKILTFLNWEIVNSPIYILQLSILILNQFL